MIARYGIIIGAMKAATTTLFDVMATHPSVAAATLKEPQFFARDDRFANGPDWYRGLWPTALGDDVVAMEASTQYTMRHFHPVATDRIADHPGDFRFVYVVRHPVDRIESHYQHALAVGWPVANDPLDSAARQQALLDPCRYAWQLDPYRERFGAESVLVLRFEDVVADLTGAGRRIAEHWNIDPTTLGSVDLTHENRTADKVVSARVHALRKVPGARRAARMLDGRIARRAKRLVSTGEQATTRLRPATRQFVLDELKPDLERLAVEWGVPTADWIDGGGASGTVGSSADEPNHAAHRRPGD